MLYAIEIFPQFVHLIFEEDENCPPPPPSSKKFDFFWTNPFFQAEWKKVLAPFLTKISAL
jgi:hypothetical protein